MSISKCEWLFPSKQQCQADATWEVWCTHLMGHLDKTKVCDEHAMTWAAHAIKRGLIDIMMGERIQS
jgi:hypothetical protein